MSLFVNNSTGIGIKIFLFRIIMPFLRNKDNSIFVYSNRHTSAYHHLKMLQFRIPKTKLGPVSHATSQELEIKALSIYSTVTALSGKLVYSHSTDV